MKKLVFYLLLVILFSNTASAGASKYPDPPEYVEGEVIAAINAPAFDDYNDMDAYTEAIQLQAEALAGKYGIQVQGILPYMAKETGKNIIHLRSETKRTNELMKELSSDPNVISVEPNYIMKYINPAEEDNSGCNACMGSISLVFVGFILLAIKRIKR